MKAMPGVGLRDVQAVYSGPEGDLWELKRWKIAQGMFVAVKE